MYVSILLGHGEGQRDGCTARLYLAQLQTKQSALAKTQKVMPSARMYSIRLAQGYRAL